jgi:hypothetical protein
MNKQFCDKIAHYASREPKQFLQLDSFYMPDGGDDVMHPDKDGDALLALETIELMRCCHVRVLIPDNIDVKVAVRQLKKVAKWLKRKPDLLEYAKPKVEPNSDCAPDYGLPF